MYKPQAWVLEISAHFSTEDFDFLLLPTEGESVGAHRDAFKVVEEGDQIESTDFFL